MSWNGADSGDWTPFVTLQRWPENCTGRDFVVGDIHGAFLLVYAAMGAVGFDPQRDRLFCTGDLIDRGPQSADVARFLAHPFVHAVCGNHEANLLARHAETPPSAAQQPALAAMDALWWLETTADERRAIVPALTALPLAMEIATARGSVGIIHADVPEGMDWATFLAALEHSDATAVHTCLWGRERLNRDRADGVAGVGRLFVGHTPQWLGARRCGNVYALDTGAVFGLTGQVEEGCLTMAQLATSTHCLAGPPTSPGLLNLRVEQPLLDSPFGSYAR